MFSGRTRWDLTPNRISTRINTHRESGRPIIDLTESNPTRCGLGLPVDALAAILCRGAALAYDPDPLGRLAARESICQDYGSRGVSVSPDRLLLTASTSEAYSFLFRLLADPGDSVLVPTPSYPLFEHLAGICDVTLTHYPLIPELDFAIDLDTVASLIGARTRAILVVNPGNPTGAYLRSAEASALVELCRASRIALISDEVFSDFPLAEGDGRVRTLAGTTGALTFALNGLSKMMALPHLKLAWMAVSGPAAMTHDAMQKLSLIADTFLSVNGPVQHALPELLTMRGPIQRVISERLLLNRHALRAAVAAHRSCRLLATEAGWTAILAVPRTRSDEDWVLRLLDAEGVLMHPGFFFNFPTEGMLVVSLLTPSQVFAEGIGKALERIDAEA